MDYSLAHLQLARHIIGWSHIPPCLTSPDLPTTIGDSQRYLETSQNQQDCLVLALGAKPEAVRIFRATGAPLDSFFHQQRRAFPWMDSGLVQEAVLGNLRWVDHQIGLLRKILGVWTSQDVALTSEHTLSPFTSVRGLHQLFSAYSTFATDVLTDLSDDLTAGVLRFYNLDERRRRGLLPPDPRRSLIPFMPIQ